MQQFLVNNRKYQMKWLQLLNVTNIISRKQTFTSIPDISLVDVSHMTWTLLDWEGLINK